MPKVGMEPIRRAALVDATIAEIGVAGTMDITVSRIAKRAGMSSALAHHYFGGKEQIFLAAMRHILALYGAEVRGALMMTETPRARLEAIVRASFTGGHFRREIIASWLNFYVLAQVSDEAARLLRVYQKRLHSNLAHALRPMVGDRADAVAYRVAALIDGAYLSQSLGEQNPDGKAAVAHVFQLIKLELRETA